MKRRHNGDHEVTNGATEVTKLTKKAPGRPFVIIVSFVASLRGLRGEVFAAIR
jgi:hypothetical protein